MFGLTQEQPFRVQFPPPFGDRCLVWGDFLSGHVGAEDGPGRLTQQGRLPQAGFYLLLV